MKVYLDNAATTPMAPEVIREMTRVMEGKFGNPSSIHTFGREVRAEIEVARKRIAQYLNTSPGSLFFTSGGTEADNTAIRCAVEAYQVKRIISTPIEHHAVEYPVLNMKEMGLAQVDYVKLTPEGHVDLDHLEQLLVRNSGKTLVSLMHANNEIGNLLDLHAVGELCAKYNAIFHSDTVQTMGHYAFDLSTLPVHFITCSAHKFHGPKGIGFLYVHPDVKIKPFILGGAQERNMRGGTENVYGIVGLATAMDLAHEDLVGHQQLVQGLKDQMIKGLHRIFPDIRFNGDIHPERSLYTVLNVALPNTDIAEMLLFNLDIMGVAASGGSACSSGSDAGSHVLRALMQNPDRPNIRFSFSRYNTPKEIDYALNSLEKLYKKESVS